MVVLMRKEIWYNNIKLPKKFSENEFKKHLFSERLLHEDIINRRFTFLITFVSIIVTGLITLNTIGIKSDIDTTKGEMIVCVIGILLTTILGYMIYRTQKKYDILLNYIHDIIPSHPASIIHNNVKGISDGIIIGRILPIIFIIFLISYFIMKIL